MVTIVNLIMKKRKKKKDKQNTDKLVTEDSLTNTNNFTDINKFANNDNQVIPTDSLRNYTGRPWPMTPKAGVTLQRRRYQFGGNYGG